MRSFNFTWKELFVAKRIVELDKRWVRPRDLGAVLKALPKNIAQQVLSTSAEGREIVKLKFGHGPKPVLAWAAMHGNETTALRGWLDLLVSLEDAAVKPYFKTLLNEYTIHFIPMLNPDGAERYTRRNAQGIDMNRDARALESPEMQVLLKQVEAIKPILAFNLHDQRNIFAVNGKPATLSFLAPSIDEKRSITPERELTMDLIAAAAQQVKPIITGGIGRYTDEYYPTAIGERIQQMGIPTILVECGPALNDPLRQQARMANPVILHAVLNRLLAEEHRQTEVYLNIPLNENKQVDVLITGIECKASGLTFNADLALLNEESVLNGIYQTTLKVLDFGDLRQYSGLKKYRCLSTLEFNSSQIGKLADLKLETDQGLLNIKEGKILP